MNPEAQRAPRGDIRKARIIASCFEQVQSGQASIEDCVVGHPRFKDLKRLLHTAFTLPRLTVDPSEGPDPDRVAMHKAALMAQFSVHFPEQGSQEPQSST